MARSATVGPARQGKQTREMEKTDYGLLCGKAGLFPIFRTMSLRGEYTI